MIYAVVLSIIVAVLLGTAVVRSLTVKSQADFLVAGRTPLGLLAAHRVPQRGQFRGAGNDLRHALSPLAGEAWWLR